MPLCRRGACPLSTLAVACNRICQILCRYARTYGGQPCSYIRAVHNPYGFWPPFNDGIDAFMKRVQAKEIVESFVLELVMNSCCNPLMMGNDLALGDHCSYI